MPRNGSGLYFPPPANYPAVSATLITAADRNAIDADLATALTNSIAVNGESVVTADIPFGNNKLTGVKDGTLAKDAANVSQIQNSNAILLASVAGTDTITASLSPALTAYANGQIFTLIPANTNTGAVTININGLGAKSITKNGSTALVAGDLVAGVEYSLQYDGTRFQKVAGSDYAKSGANSDITSLSGLTTPYAESGANSDITSLTALTAITAGAVTVAADDKVLIQDTSASDVLKTVTTQSIADLPIVSPTKTIGYGTGAGGTVTQATSKFTAVTLNKPCGLITMHNAALAAGDSVYFTLNNTLLASADVVGVTLNSYGSNYRVETVNITNGSVVFRVTNVTVNPLSESLVINFAIIKGANS